MFIKNLTALAVATCVALPALAQEIQIEDPYMRTSGPMARTGAAFMHIINQGDVDDRLIAARSDIAKRVELHTHKETGDGIMQMMEVEEGFQIPAGEMHGLMRGGDHVMFMGLTAKIAHGDQVDVILIFENAGEIAVSIPVDLERQPGAGMHMQNQNMQGSDTGSDS